MNFSPLRRWRAVLPVVVFLSVIATGANADSVRCHYTYGGETQALIAEPLASPYTDGSIPVGSYFRFRVVFQDRPADTAAIKVYTYANRDDGPVLIHQATFPYPPVFSSATNPPPVHGFTGLHFVYEPIRDGELQYWCELLPSP